MSERRRAGELREYAGLLQEGAQALGAPLVNSQAEKMLRYLALLQKWNRRFNLSALNAPAEMISGLLLDSLSLLPHIRPEVRRVLDVGSGAGLPGIPLAVCSPERSFFLLDRSANRCRFLAQARLELELDNVRTVQAQVQEYRPARKPQLLTARAVMSLPRLLRAVAHLCDPGAELLLPRGGEADKELSALPRDFELLENRRLPASDGGRARRLLRLRRRGAAA